MRTLRPLPVVGLCLKNIHTYTHTQEDHTHAHSHNSADWPGAGSPDAPLAKSPVRTRTLLLNFISDTQGQGSESNRPLGNAKMRGYGYRPAKAP
ncbi:hypothetical protein [Pandoravirus japonicus]|uniref:Uncharacterized protein n=1 Tax=Pandoravirus japonicus TaxID=2823154 RepID=A0A811BNL0_9VIRU|nr:hypothetical protein [Pandoravirus japonicus]